MGDHAQDRRSGQLSVPRRAAAPRDTIAAIATAHGRAGIGIVRVSGPDAREIGARVLDRAVQARYASVRTFRGADGVAIDRGIALWFPAPASYTGEDVLELHAHGGAVVLEMLLGSVLHAGARLARPGEFTERAFLEGRLDLAQAEAVADLIDAGSRQAVRAAQATLHGEFSRRVDAITRRITELRVVLEASLDFADEEVDALSGDALAAALAEISHQLRSTLDAAMSGVKLRDGLRVVLVGAPNVGKSSVMNRLAGEERAIVTPVPGTTRDVIRETVHVAGATIELLDTAGLRESADPVEQAGIARTREQANSADLVLLVADDRHPVTDAGTLCDPVAETLHVRNKIDLSGAPSGPFDGGVRVSALTGAGFDDLVREIASRVSRATGGGSFTARARHVEALRDALACAHRASVAHREAAGVELVAADLREAQVAVGRITGAVSSDDLLGRIFASFCIGK